VPGEIRSVTRLLALVLLVGVAAPAAAKARVRLKRIGRFDDPIYVAAPPSDQHRVFVVEQGGRIRVVRDGRVLRRPFLDIRSLVRSESEMGLLSMAFAPDYATSRRFYVFYTDPDVKEHVVEYRAGSDDVADPASARTLLVEDDPDFNNNGGQLQFGPDGLLYISNGDGGGQESGPPDPYHTAQDLGSRFGKILRIDPTGTADGEYRIPPGNPYQANGEAPEIYAYGLRNPWRFSFDRQTGALVVADVGQQSQEEVDYFRRGQGLGANLGWPHFEGTKRRRGGARGVRPALTIAHDSGFCAIVGGYVSRDPRVKTTLGRYLFGDFCTGELRAARLPHGRPRRLGVRVANLDSFGEDARGRVYAVSINGPVYRIAARR
jgi:glucose/arabinose dehydrogenase